VHRSKADFEALGTKVLVIGFESESRARDWLDHNGFSFPFLLDETRNVYRAYGPERSMLRSLNPGNLWLHTKAVLTGQRLKMIKADPTQLGADFVIDTTGIIRLAYYSRNATDRPSVRRLLEILGQARRAG
jgi:hypothetical protein